MKWFNARNTAILLGIVLLSLCVGAVIRHTGGQDSESKSSSSQTTADTPAVPEQDDRHSKAKSEEVESKQVAPPVTKPTVAVPQQKTAETTAYTYTASPGDSYTGFARDAIAKLLATDKLTATPAQLLNTEVLIANAANSPLLEIGQSVSISKDTISSAMQSSGIAPALADSQTATNKTEEKPGGSDSYSTTAVSGDAYVTIARTAIRQHLDAHKKTLTDSQLIAAETKIADNAGWPDIQVGQTITIDATALQNAISFANGLDAASQSAWLPYTFGVSFS